MIAFLRRLAPPRAADAACATAVLPAPFSGRQPLRSASDVEQADRPAEPDEPAAAMHAGSLPATAPPWSARQPLAGAAYTGAARQAGAAPLRSGSTPLSHAEPGAGSPSSSTPAAGATPAVSGAPAKVRPPQSNAMPATPLRRPAPPMRAADASSATPAVTPGAAFEASLPQPMSQAVLSQRGPDPRGGPQVVHVSIGRIDVVASVAPAPAAPRAAKPRPPTVALADYLRAGSGGQR